MVTQTESQEDSTKQEETTLDSCFDDIRHYRDDEVPNAVKRIIEDDDLVGGIVKFMIPSVPGFAVKIIKPVVKLILKYKFGRVRTVKHVQEYVAKFMGGVIKDTTDGFTYSGFDSLKPDEGYLFISNHRDISLDPAFINMALFYSGFDTVKIAIGDNLLRMPVATALMKLNKSFIVKRSLTSPKEKFKAFMELSAYIGLSIKENHNVWIAQREGRAKDGNDVTEEAIIKMLYMRGKKEKESFPEYIKKLHIVPVSITYEYDPGDVAKAHEVYEKAENGKYVKSKYEDMDSIVGGIRGYKGHVHLSAGAPLEGEFSDAKAVAEAIDTFIYTNYKRYPSMLIAAGIDDSSITDADRQKFNDRMNKIPEELRPLVKEMYATPYFNYKKEMERNLKK